MVKIASPFWRTLQGLIGRLPGTSCIHENGIQVEVCQRIVLLARHEHL